jgi:hypothetical protein
MATTTPAAHASIVHLRPVTQASFLKRVGADA